jgi:general secretion pathway protein A
MYTAFYGLREKPFSLTPDPRYLFLSASHREALAHLLYGIEQGEGFIAVTGEVGTGKTTLCRTLLERLGPETDVAFVFNPTLTGEQLLRAICEEFGLATAGLGGPQLSSQLNEFLLTEKRMGRRVLLIIDEAQNLESRTLEEIRLLSNLETSTSKLIQILLFGQPELDEKLDSKELRQLRQRISVRWSLTTLSSTETADYVRHRLHVAAGQDPGDLFHPRALREVQRRTGGVPRLVNLLCDRSLLAGYAAGDRIIEQSHVAQAANEILGARRRRIGRRFPWRRSAIAGAVLAAVAASAWVWQQRHDVFPAGSEPSSPASVSAAPPTARARGASEVDARSLPTVSMSLTSEEGAREVLE